MPQLELFKAKLLSSLFLISMLGLYAFPIHAIGLSPVDIIADDVLSNSSVAKEIYISRGDASEEALVIITFDGAASPYIKTPLGTDVLLPAGERSFAYPLVIEPGSLASGTYQTKITVTATEPPATTNPNGSEETNAGTTILSGSQGLITFTVTNKAIEAYNITGVTMAASEENQLVGFSYQMFNTGNVDTRPAKIEFLAVDELDASNTYSETILAERLAIVPAFSDQTITVATQAQLTVGLYNITLTFYDEADEVIYTSDTLRLQIFPEGTLAQKGELTAFLTDKADYQVAEPVILTADFKNTGTIGINASLVVEILKDGTRLDILKTEPVFVPVGQTANMEQSFKPTEGGTYTAVGYVNYGIFTTEKIETEFVVDALSNTSVALFIGCILLAAGAVTFWVYHRKRKKKN